MASSLKPRFNVNQSVTALEGGAMTDRQTIVIDSNVFMGAGTAPFTTYKNSDIVVPYAVIGDLERHLKDTGGTGWACRSVLNAIEDIRSQSGHSLMSDGSRPGVSFDNNGNTLCIVKSDHVIPSGRSYDSHSRDYVLDVVNILSDKKHGRVTLVSNSLATRLQAGESVSARPYDDDSFTPFNGIFDIKSDVLDCSTDEAKNASILDVIAKQSSRDGHSVPVYATVRLHWSDSNPQYLIKQGDNLSVLDTHIRDHKITPRRNNIEQAIALTYLRNPNINAISFGGVAGAGKTFLALATAMNRLGSKDDEFDKIIVYRSATAVGGENEKLGFMPGGPDEKMDHWAPAIWDNVVKIDQLIRKAKRNSNDSDNVPRASAKHNSNDSDNVPRASAKNIAEAKKAYDGVISVEGIENIRGRSLDRTCVIVDDAQNLERANLLHIVTRMGYNSRLILTHDMSQIDNRYISSGTSILTVVNDLLAWPQFATLDFTKSERSPFAQFGADLLARDM